MSLRFCAARLALVPLLLVLALWSIGDASAATPTASQDIASKSLTAGAASGFIPVTGSGGTGRLSYSIQPSLSAGLLFDIISGQVSGIPTAAQAATTYTVTVADSSGGRASATFSLTVNDAVTATQNITSVALTANHLATTFTPVNGSGGTGPLAYSISPTLPTGLSISPATGAISGTPTDALTQTHFTVTVTDANGETATAPFSLSVNSTVDGHSGHCVGRAHRQPLGHDIYARQRFGWHGPSWPTVSHRRCPPA